MMILYRALLPALLAFLVQDAAGQSAESASLRVDVDTPAVSVQQRDRQRNFLRLPTLDYKFELDARCASGLMPVSISLSVADTRKSLSRSDMSVDVPTATSLAVPAAQIGPVAVAGFCVVPDEESVPTEEPESLEIKSVVSAQVSLLCASETEKQMTYVSKSLDVTLLCEIPQGAQIDVSAESPAIGN